MPIFYLVILALVQGITEFLPISSSGHLVLTHHFLIGDTNIGEDLTMDVAVHVGTLFAVLVYFCDDILRMRQNRHMLSSIIIASLPVIIAGFGMHFWEPAFLRSVYLMAWMTLIFGIVLWWADKQDVSRKLEKITTKNAFLIGCAQILALIPGVSRSGITMTAARALGFNREDAAKFSLFLAIVAISGAGTLKGLSLWQSGNLALGLDAAIGIALSFISGIVAIALMMRWLQKASFMPFVIYRIVLGILLLGLLYSGIIT